MKTVPQTAEAYAKYLYMEGKCTGRSAGEFNDRAIIDIRVKAFMDGVSWAKRQRRTLGKGAQL